MAQRRAGRLGLRGHPGRGRGGRPELDAGRVDAQGQADGARAWRRASWPAWSPSRRRRASSTHVGRPGHRPGRRRRLLRRGLPQADVRATTTRSTPSAFTASAASWGPCLTGVFCEKVTHQRERVGVDGLLASGSSSPITHRSSRRRRRFGGFAFSITLVLAKLIDVLFGFTTDAKSK